MSPAPLLLRLVSKARATAAMEAACEAARATAAVAEAFETAWSGLRAVEERAGPLACRAGCSACCHQPVAVLPIEAAAIATALLAADDPRPRERLSAAARDATDRGGARQPCGFLGPDGTCAIHPVRPQRCRGLHSRDAAACATAAGAGGAEPAGRGGERSSIPLLPIRLADAALTGLAEACASRGIAIGAVELVPAVALLLASPERIATVMSGRDGLREAGLDRASRTVAKR